MSTDCQLDCGCVDFCECSAEIAIDCQISFCSPDTMTKSDEKRLLSAIVQEMPDGYLRDILKALSTEIHGAIDNDYVCTLTDFRRDIRNATEQLDALRKEVKELQQRAENARIEIARAERKMSDARAMADTLRRTVQAIREF